MTEERNSYGGQWKVPITPYNKRLYWPPKWVQCDCGELAQQGRVRKSEFFYPTEFYHCKNCQRTYQLITGTSRFVLVTDDEKKD